MDQPFVGNYFAGKEVQKWLQSTSEENINNKRRLDFSSLLILIGPVGSGKTFGIKKICERIGKQLHIFDSQNTENFKNIHEKITKISSANVATQFRFSKQEDVVILIDEIEALLTVDRSFLHALQRLVSDGSLPHVPIILTSQHVERKRVYEAFQGKSPIIELKVPSDADLLLFLRSMAPGASLEKLGQICDQCYGNISVALQMLHVGKQTAIDKISTTADLYLDPNPHTARFIFLEDPWIYPLMFHENMVHEINERKGANLKKHKVYDDILEGICTWDMMMSYFKGTDLQIPVEYAAQLTTFLQLLERKKNGKVPSDDFTKMFSHMSLEKKNQVALYDHDMEMINHYYRKLYQQTKSKKKGKSFL